MRTATALAAASLAALSSALPGPAAGQSSSVVSLIMPFFDSYPYAGSILGSRGGPATTYEISCATAGGDCPLLRPLTLIEGPGSLTMSLEQGAHTFQILCTYSGTTTGSCVYTVQAGARPGVSTTEMQPSDFRYMPVTITEGAATAAATAATATMATATAAATGAAATGGSGPATATRTGAAPTSTSGAGAASAAGGLGLGLGLGLGAVAGLLAAL